MCLYSSNTCLRIHINTLFSLKSFIIYEKLRFNGSLTPLKFINSHICFPVTTNNKSIKMNTSFAAALVYLVFRPIFDCDCGFLGTGEISEEDAFRINSGS